MKFLSALSILMLVAGHMSFADELCSISLPNLDSYAVGQREQVYQGRNIGQAMFLDMLSQAVAQTPVSSNCSSLKIEDGKLKITDWSSSREMTVAIPNLDCAYYQLFGPGNTRLSFVFKEEADAEAPERVYLFEAYIVDGAIFSSRLLKYKQYRTWYSKLGSWGLPIGVGLDGVRCGGGTPASGR